MITAQTLKQLTTVTIHGLKVYLHNSGYTGASFTSAKFVGITNEGQFCYAVTFPDEAGTGVTKGKVFLTYDQTTGTITADY